MMRPATGVPALAAWLLAACVALACHSVGRVDPGFFLRSRKDSTLYERAVTADRLHGQGRSEEAAHLVDELLDEDPLFVPAWRLRQDELRQQGRIGIAWDELARLKAEHPDRPEPIYLEARLIPGFEEKELLLYAGHERFPGSYWLRYGVAWCLLQRGRKREARAILDALLQSGLPWPQTWILFLASQTSSTSPSPLLPRLEKWSARFPADGRLEGMIYARGGGSLGNLLGAVEKAPSYSGVQTLLRGGSIFGLKKAHRRPLIRHLAAHEEVRARLIAAGAGLRIALLALADGEPSMAEEWLRAALREPGPGPAEKEGLMLRTAHRELMRLQLQRGDLAAAIAVWESWLPVEQIATGRNLIGPRLRALREGPTRGLKGRPADSKLGAEILGILLRAGWVAEAEILGRSFLRCFPDDAAILALVEEARSFLRFQAELADLFMMNQRLGTKQVTELRTLLERLRERSVKTLGQDVVGRPDILSFPVLGMEMVDPFGPGLPRYMDRYNRHFILGKGLGRGLELVIGIKLSEQRLPPDPALPLAGECREVLIENKEVLSVGESGMEDPAGIALWNHYVLDFRAMSRWHGDQSRILQRLQQQGLARVTEDPFPPQPALSLARPSQVDRKLLGEALLQEPRADGESRWEQLFELLRKHERAHLVESHRYLPVFSHLLPALGLFLSSGLSADRLMAGSEGRAECAALAFGARPRLVLSHLASFVSNPAGPAATVHGRGFARILELLLETWKADGAPGARYPDNNLLAQLHLMPEDKAVQYAREVLERQGF